MIDFHQIKTERPLNTKKTNFLPLCIHTAFPFSKHKLLDLGRPPFESIHLQIIVCMDSIEKSPDFFTINNILYHLLFSTQSPSLFCSPTIDPSLILLKQQAKGRNRSIPSIFLLPKRQLEHLLFRLLLQRREQTRMMLLRRCMCSYHCTELT